MLREVGLILQRRGDYRGAEDLIRQSLAMVEATLGEDHPQAADLLNRLASVRWWQGDLEASEALEIVRSAVGREHSVYWILTANEAVTLRAQEGCGRAEKLLRDAIAGMRRTIPGDRYRIPSQQRWLGTCLTELGRYAEAEAILNESYQIFRETRGDDDEFTRDVAERLATLYSASGRMDRAAELRKLAAAPRRGEM